MENMPALKTLRGSKNQNRNIDVHEDKASGHQDRPDLEVVICSEEETLNNSELDVDANLEKEQLKVTSSENNDSIEVIPSDVAKSNTSSEHAPDRPYNTRQHAKGSTKGKEDSTQIIRNRGGSLEDETDSDSTFTVSSEEDSSVEDFVKPTTSRTHHKRNSACAGQLPWSRAHQNSSALTLNQKEPPQCKRGVASVNTDNGFSQTGPTSFLYLDKFPVEKVQTGYRCDRCGLIKDEKRKIRSHIQSFHAHVEQVYKNDLLIRTGYGTYIYMEKFGINLDDEVYTCLVCEHKDTPIENLMEHIRRVHANRGTQSAQTCSDSRGPEEVYETDSDSILITSSDNSDDEVKRVEPAVSRQPNKKNQTKSVCARKLPSQPKRRTSNLSNQDDLSQSQKDGNDDLIKTGPNTFLYLEKFGLEKVEKGYKCDHCGLIKAQRREIKIHVRGVHARIIRIYKNHRLIRTGYGTFVYMDKFGINLDDGVYTCRVCEHKHAKVEKLMDHIRTVHAENGPHHANMRMVQKSPNKWYYDEYVAEKVENEYCCVTCGYIIEDQEKMRHHLRYSHYLPAHPEEVPSVSLVCKVCGKEFPKLINLKKHQDTHCNELKFTCEFCEKRFNTRCKLRLHRRVHLGDEGKRFVCELCGRKFWCGTILKNHLCRHTGQRRFECKNCGKMHASYCGLRLHRTSHTGKNYSCDICGMEFTQPYSVIRHKGTAHGKKKLRKRKRKTGALES